MRTGLSSSNGPSLIAATPYEMLSFMRRGTSGRDYLRLKAALDRLQSTTVATTIRQPTDRRMHRFSWINEWKERADHLGRAEGIELILPDWFYSAVLDDKLVLTIDAAYFDLTGGLERWLYRLVRKHGGRQRGGWRFELRHLHHKSGSAGSLRRFAFEVRDIVRRQPLPGYRLAIEPGTRRDALLAFSPTPCGQAVDGLVLSGTPPHVLSGTADTCFRERKRQLSPCAASGISPPNLESNQEPKLVEARAVVDRLARRLRA